MLLWLATCLMPLQACIDTDNHGFPNKVFIPADGSMVIAEGDQCVTYIEFLNGNTYEKASEILHDDDDIITGYKYSWLTIECGYSENGYMLKFTAEPNETTKRRTLTIQPQFIYTWALGNIKVIQGAQ